MVLPGLRQTSDGGPASPPYTASSYTWDITTLIITGSLTVQGDFTFGDASTDSLTVLGVLNQTTTLTATDTFFEQAVTTTATSGTVIGHHIDITNTGSGATVYGLVVEQNGSSTQALASAIRILNAASDTITTGIDFTAAAGTITIGIDLTASGTMSQGIKLGSSGGASSASGLLMGIGTSGSPSTTSTADAKFIEIRAQSTATSGDNRLLYMRYELNGTGGGEALRAFTKVTAIVGTARGAHISIDTSTAGQITGLGVGVDAQILMPGEAGTGGTWAVVNAEIFTVSSTTVGSNTMSFFRAGAGGDGTAIADVDDNAFFLELFGIAAGTGNIIDTNITTHTAYGGLKVKIPGVGTRWLALVSA